MTRLPIHRVPKPMALDAGLNDVRDWEELGAWIRKTAADAAALGIRPEDIATAAARFNNTEASS